MKGIYIHIPFCRQACRYCDFYFTVSLKFLDRFVDALVEEIRNKGEKHAGNPVDTLYLGGGTPSLLSMFQLEKILDAIHRYYSFQKNPEWTIECNPEDVDESRVKTLKEYGFNRLSMGIQSFYDRDLELMRRSHDASQAEFSVKKAAAGGFDNITIDLIYGIPGQVSALWEGNIEKALSLPISHLSAYHLTFEPRTVFDHWIKKGKLLPVPEKRSIEQYNILREKTKSAGFGHYELSNFGLGGIVSRHNLLYWSGDSYVGFGPSAHSFNRKQRSWNISSLKAYMEGIEGADEIEERELLSPKEQYHDYLITSLRTKWGADPEYIEEFFGKQVRIHFEKKIKTFIEGSSMYTASGRVLIEPGKWLITDHILRSLFLD
jgi:oxygen-independent coproporphyrinogen-3 oxidase